MLTVELAVTVQFHNVCAVSVRVLSLCACV